MVTFLSVIKADKQWAAERH